MSDKNIDYQMYLDYLDGKSSEPKPETPEVTVGTDTLEREKPLVPFEESVKPQEQPQRPMSRLEEIEQKYHLDHNGEESGVHLMTDEEFAEKYGEFIRLAHRDISAEDFRRFVILGKSCDTLNTYDSLDKIKCPTLVIGAKNDRVLTAQASVEIAGKLGCECYLYGEEYGHCVFDEAPDYKSRIMKFFKSEV